MSSQEIVRLQALAGELSWYPGLTEGVLDQTRRRVLNGEKVPASEKVVSIFEDHTDKGTWRSLPSFHSYIWAIIGSRGKEKDPLVVTSSLTYRGYS